MATDGGSPNTIPSPADAGALPVQGGNTGGGNVPGHIPVELRAAAENLGIKLVPEVDWAEREKVYGSVKHGNIAEKLNRLNKYEEDAQKRADGELSELQRAQKEAADLRAQNDSAAAEIRAMALRTGFLTENAKRAMADSKELAVFPEIMDMYLPTLLPEFKGGDPDEFVKNGLDKMLGVQATFLKRLGGEPGNAPGGSPVSPSGAQGEQLPRRSGSVVKELVDWRSRVAFTNHPHIVQPPGVGGKR